MAANSKFAVATHILTALAYLASNPDPHHCSGRADGLISSDTIALSVNTNPVVVRRLLSQLSKAGIVDSHLGKQGGVRLARLASEISLLDIYNALGEGPLFTHNPNTPNPNCPVSLKIKTIIQPVFDTLTDAVQRRLAGISLQHILDNLR